MKRFLIAFDLDDTVLPRIDTIDPRTVRAIKGVKEAGHLPIIASARSFPMFRWVYEAMELDTPVCTINGAWVFHPHGGAFAGYETEIPVETTDMIINEAVILGCDMHTYIECKDVFYHTAGPHSSYYEERIKYSFPAILFDRTSPPSTPASRIILSPPSNEAAKQLRDILERAAGDSLKIAIWSGKKSPVNPSGIRMNIGPAAADKWNAVNHIARYYGIADENIYAFGDTWNDYAMLRGAARSYAIKGSPAQRDEVAKHVTRLNCRDCGVADIIEREILSLSQAAEV